MMENKDIWVVIPAYNEESKIGSVIDEVKKYCKNVIVADDGSNDNTYKIARSKGVFVLRHIINLGKGAAVKTGCDFAVKKGAEVIILIDADGQHEPKEIPNFLKAIRGCDVVFGIRKMGGQMPFILSFGNRFINKTIGFLYSLKLKDTQCGYRAFTKEAYKKIRWRASDYSMESEMIANAGKKHLNYRQIPIETIYGDKYKGTTVIDGVKIVFNMFLWRLRR